MLFEGCAGHVERLDALDMDDALVLLDAVDDGVVVACSVVCRENLEGAAVVGQALGLAVGEVDEHVVARAVRWGRRSLTIVLRSHLRSGNCCSCAHADVHGGAEVCEVIGVDLSDVLDS